MMTEKKKNEIPAEEVPVNELRERLWAVITFDQCAARNLTYVEAEQKIAELERARVAGLCIVPNTVADRLGTA